MRRIKKKKLTLHQRYMEWREAEDKKVLDEFSGYHSPETHPLLDKYREGMTSFERFIIEVDI